MSFITKKMKESESDSFRLIKENTDGTGLFIHKGESVILKRCKNGYWKDPATGQCVPSDQLRGAKQPKEVKPKDEPQNKPKDEAQSKPKEEPKKDEAPKQDKNERILNLMDDLSGSDIIQSKRSWYSMTQNIMDDIEDGDYEEALETLEELMFKEAIQDSDIYSDLYDVRNDLEHKIEAQEAEREKERIARLPKADKVFSDLKEAGLMQSNTKEGRKIIAEVFENSGILPSKTTLDIRSDEGGHAMSIYVEGESSDESKSETMDKIYEMAESQGLIPFKSGNKVMLFDEPEEYEERSAWGDPSQINPKYSKIPSIVDDFERAFKEDQDNWTLRHIVNHIKNGAIVYDDKKKGRTYEFKWKGNLPSKDSRPEFIEEASKLGYDAKFYTERGYEGFILVPKKK